MSNLNPLYQSSRTPVRTRSHNHFKKSSVLPQRSILQPTNFSSLPVPVSSFTFSIDLKTPAPAMPPKVASNLSHETTKKKVSRNYKAKGSKNAVQVAANRTLMAVASSSRTSTKRALSPVMIIDRDDSPPKRFKLDISVDPPIIPDTDTNSTDGSVPPSSTDVSMSGVESVLSDVPTVSDGPRESGSGDDTTLPASSMERTGPPSALPADYPAGRTTPVNFLTSQTPTNAARLEISKTPKAPWLTGKSYTPKVSPMKKFTARPLQPLVRTPARFSVEHKSSNGTGARDLFPSAASTSKAATSTPLDPFGTGADETKKAASSSTTTSSHIPKPTSPVKKSVVSVPTSNTLPHNRNVSAAFALPVSLSPTKTPAKPHLASVAKPRMNPKPSILNRTASSSGFSSDGGGGSQSSAFKPNLSSTLAALMNRTTVNPHAATQAQLSTLSQALEELDAPRPSSSVSQRPPMSRPSTSLGFLDGSKRGAKGNAQGQQTKLTRPGLTSGQGSRPGTSLGVSSLTRLSKPTGLASQGRPPVASLQQLNNVASMEARRASTASFALSQSLPVTAKPGAKPPVPIYTTASGRRVVSAAARAAPLSSSGPKEQSMDDVSMANASDSLGSSGGPSSTPTAPRPPTPASSVPLDILKECVIFVDVKTEDGEDAGSLFVDMLRGLGAKILGKPGSSLTHIVYKSGLQSTLTRYRALAEPKPAVVGIGWVVECVEKREKVEPTRYLINLEEEAGSVLEGLKPSTAKAAASKGATTTSKAQGKPIQTKLQFKAAPKGA